MWDFRRQEIFFASTAARGYRVKINNLEKEKFCFFSGVGV